MKWNIDVNNLAKQAAARVREVANSDQAKKLMEQASSAAQSAIEAGQAAVASEQGQKVIGQAQELGKQGLGKIREVVESPTTQAAVANVVVKAEGFAHDVAQKVVQATEKLPEIKE